MECVGDGNGGAGAGEGGEGEDGLEMVHVLVVGFAFMAKKMDSMAEVMSISEGPVDGVEFLPLDFSQRPNEHRHLDVILHKLSEDIMYRNVRPEGDARISWIEAYLAGNPGTVIVDPIDRVAKCINRVTTLELLKEAYRLHGAAGGMPRPPRFTVLLPKNDPDGESSVDLGTSGFVPESGLSFPVICKPVEACGTRGSHEMVVVLDEAGMVALKPPVVVQECRNHGAKLYKVCVVGDEVRVHERPSLEDLPSGLTGSFSFDSQKPYPTLAQVEAASALMSSRPPHPAPGTADPSSPPNRSKLSRVQAAATEATPNASGLLPLLQNGGGHTTPSPTVPPPVVPLEAATAPHPIVSLEAARRAAARMKETFGLSMFGFDLIVDGVTGEALVIDVNYFPSFKDVRDFPQLLRRLLKEVASTPPPSSSSSSSASSSSPSRRETVVVEDSQSSQVKN